MERIKIKKSINSPENTQDPTISKKMLLEDTESHINDVKNLASLFCELLKSQAVHHDHTKTAYFDEYWVNYILGKQGKDFKSQEWWSKHREERHHLTDRVPEDVNLIDVIEMICDCVSAGLARSGDVYPFGDLNPNMLVKAVENTKCLLIDYCDVVDKEDSDSFLWLK